MHAWLCACSIVRRCICACGAQLAQHLLGYVSDLGFTRLQAQDLDGMDLERERGITIKLNTARMKVGAAMVQHGAASCCGWA